MKHILKVLVFSLLLKVTCSLNHKFKAFVNISKALAATHHEVSVISVNGCSDFFEFAVLPNFRDQLLPHSVMTFEDLNSPEYKGINTSAVIAFNSIDSLKNFNNETYTCKKTKFNGVTTLKSDYYYPFQFFVYCPGMTRLDITSFKDNPQPKSSIMLRYEYFIVDAADFIDLWTFVWFTPEKCDQMQLVLVNQFSKKTLKWEHDTFLIEKFSNFYGCTLNFYFREHSPSYVTKKITEADCMGYLCKAAKVLSQKLNFTYTRYVERANEMNPPRMNLSFDFRWYIAALIWARTDRSFYRFYSIPFDMEDILIATPKGSDLDSYERLVRPFDTETWIWVVVTFATAFATIYVVKFGSIDVRNFVFGRDNLAPGLNVLRIFFGISQIRCPGRNFARFLMIAFVMFCMVIRTAYQAKMFEFLQMDLVKPTFDTIDELIENNYTFFMRQEFANIYSGTDFVERANIADTWDTEKNFLESIANVQEPGNDIAIEVNSNLLLELSMLGAKFEAKILKERLMSELKVMYLPAHHRFFNIFNENFKKMSEAGLFEQYIREAKEIFSRNTLQESEEPFKVLTLEELEAGFVFCMIPLLLALAVFCSEWIVTLKDLAVVLCTFQAYFGTKQVKMNKVLQSKDGKERLWKTLLTTRSRKCF